MDAVTVGTEITGETPADVHAKLYAAGFRWLPADVSGPAWEGYYRLRDGLHAEAIWCRTDPQTRAPIEYIARAVRCGKGIPEAVALMLASVTGDYTHARVVARPCDWAPVL